MRRGEGENQTVAAPAATVVVLRDGAAGIEALLVQRAATMKVGPGMWVFPGGRVEPADEEPAGHEPADQPTGLANPDDDPRIAAAARAAVREAREEVGLHLDLDGLVLLSHWLTPDTVARRFATWFFLATAPAGEVVVDGSETTDHRWLRPEDALAHHEIDLLVPTWVTLHDLAPHARVADALATAAARVAPWYQSRIVTVDAGRIAMLPGDAGYETRDAAVPGARHRLSMDREPWTFERTLDTDAAMDRPARHPA